MRGQWRPTTTGPVAVASMVDERGTQARPVDGVGMTGKVERRYHGRDFTTGEMALLRALIAASPPPTRYPHLPRPFVAATRSADYATLLTGADGHG